MLPSMFVGDKTRYNLGLFIDRSTRIDYFARYYGITITFLIMAYCLYDSKGISKEVKKYILIVAILDIIHLVLFSARGFGEFKIVLGVLILYYSDIREMILYKIRQLWKKGLK